MQPPAPTCTCTRRRESEGRAAAGSLALDQGPGVGEGREARRQTAAALWRADSMAELRASGERYLAECGVGSLAGFSLGPSAGREAEWLPLIGELPPPRHGKALAAVAAKRMLDPHGRGRLSAGSKWRRTSMRAKPRGTSPPAWMHDAPLRGPERGHGR